MKHETAAGVACAGIIAVILIALGMDALIGEILHVVFPHVLSFWKWTGLVFVFFALMGAITSRNKG